MTCERTVEWHHDPVRKASRRRALTASTTDWPTLPWRRIRCCAAGVSAMVFVPTSSSIFARIGVAPAVHLGSCSIGRRCARLRGGGVEIRRAPGVARADLTRAASGCATRDQRCARPRAAARTARSCTRRAVRTCEPRVLDASRARTRSRSERFDRAQGPRHYDVPADRDALLPLAAAPAQKFQGVPTLFPGASRCARARWPRSARWTGRAPC